MLVVRNREHVPHPCDRLGRLGAGDDVLALRADEELAVEARLARRRVTAEARAGRRSPVTIPKTICITFAAVPRAPEMLY